MKPSQLLLALVSATGLCLAGAAPAQTMNKEARDLVYKNAESQYETDKAACASLSKNAKDVCIEEAKGKEKVAKADADATYKGTPSARQAARDARAEASYAVAKEKCDDLSGNAKDVCVKRAKAARTRAKADAKVDRVASDPRSSSSEKTEARRDAAEDKRDADYKVAIEKCDTLSGAPKDACVRDAKLRFRKS